MKDDFEDVLHRSIAVPRYAAYGYAGPGYAVLGVFDDKGIDDNVLYTVGLTPILGYEMVAIAPGSIQTMTIVLNDMIKQLKENNKPQLVEYIPATLADGKINLRGKIKDVSDSQKILEFITVRVCEVKKVMQFIIADSKNLLPGEEGHDIRWKQNLD